MTQPNPAAPAQEVPADNAIVARTGCDGSVLVLALGAGVSKDRAAEVARNLREASGLNVIAVADVAAVRAWHPHDAPAELAAAMAEARDVREGYGRLCEYFGPSPQSGMSARISLTMLNRHREQAGLPVLAPREAHTKPDTWDRQQAEIDQLRDQVAAYRELLNEAGIADTTPAEDDKDGGLF